MESAIYLDSQCRPSEMAIWICKWTNCAAHYRLCIGSNSTNSIACCARCVFYEARREDSRVRRNQSPAAAFFICCWSLSRYPHLAATTGRRARHRCRRGYTALPQACLGRYVLCSIEILPVCLHRVFFVHVCRKEGTKVLCTALVNPL